MDFNTCSSLPDASKQLFFLGSLFVPACLGYLSGKCSSNSMAPSPPERNASSSSDDEEDEDHELHDKDGELVQQEDDPSPSVSFLAKENEKRVDVNFCIGADEPELHKVSPP